MAWQVAAIMFGRTNDQTVREVAQFIRVSKAIAQRVYKELCITGGHEARCQNCGS